MSDDLTTVSELKKLVDDFVTERDWSAYHDPKNLAMSIAIEAAELMEHFQWLRNDEISEATNNEEAREQIEDELSDILAYVLSFANQMDINITDALKSKMKKNAEKYPASENQGSYRKPKK